MALLTAGCTRERIHNPSFNIRPPDVISAVAAPLDSGTSPDFKAQLRLVMSAQGLARLQQFMQTRQGKVFELRINDEVLLPSVGAGTIPGTSEVTWYVSSIEQAERLAGSLTKK